MLCVRSDPSIVFAACVPLMMYAKTIGYGCKYVVVYGEIPLLVCSLLLCACIPHSEITNTHYFNSIYCFMLATRWSNEYASPPPRISPLPITRTQANAICILFGIGIDGGGGGVGTRLSGVRHRLTFLYTRYYVCSPIQYVHTQTSCTIRHYKYRGYKHQTRIAANTRAQLGLRVKYEQDAPHHRQHTAPPLLLLLLLLLYSHHSPHKQKYAHARAREPSNE